jgi:dTDP-L-rhamnose 4-epimerase
VTTATSRGSGRTRPTRFASRPASPNQRLSEHVLITGGAGFIGSHLADRLLAAGHRVRAFDNLTDQVHEGARRPEYLAADVELATGDMRDEAAVRAALEGVDSVVHLAARVGVGQSMYEVASYTSENAGGTAVLLEALAERPVRKLVVASSMSIYGEGAYEPVQPAPRTRAQLERDEWEPVGPAGEQVRAVPTPESKRPDLASVYAITKHDQERLSLVCGEAYGIPTVALRLFNTFGSRQALSNPYTGVLAIFASRLLNGNAPLVFEDGLQRRDFVSVHDVARAFELALKHDGADGRAINIGSGESVTVLEIAEKLSRTLGVEIAPAISGNYRVGDIRHCFADLALARSALGFEPQQTLEDGIVEIAEWLAGQAATDRVDEAAAELRSRGLTL